MLISGFVYVGITIDVFRIVVYFDSFFSGIEYEILGILKCSQDMKNSILL